MSKPNKFFRMKHQFKTLVTMDKISDIKRGCGNRNQFKNMMVDAQMESVKQHSKD